MLLCFHALSKECCPVLLHWRLHTELGMACRVGKVAVLLPNKHMSVCCLGAGLTNARTSTLKLFSGPPPFLPFPLSLIFPRPFWSGLQLWELPFGSISQATETDSGRASCSSIVTCHGG